MNKIDWQQKFEKETGNTREMVLSGLKTATEYHCDLSNYLSGKLCAIKNFIDEYKGDDKQKIRDTINCIMGE